MSVDVFGHLLTQNSMSAAAGTGPPGVGFKLTAGGDYDLENKRLCNVATAVDANDAITLRRLEDIIGEKLNDFRKEIKIELGNFNERLNIIERKLEQRRLERKRKREGEKEISENSVNKTKR